MKLQDILNSAKELANTIIESGLYEGTEIEQRANEILQAPESDLDSLIEDYYSDTDRIAILWGKDDVVHRAKEIEVEITDDDALDVLQRLENDHDCNIGITWDVIDCYINDL